MLRVFFVRATLVALACMAAPIASAEEPSIKPTRVVLDWHNGDYLPGSILSADGEKLNWKSDLFVDPLQLRRDALRSIRWQNDQPSQLVRKGYRATTIDGDLIVGDLVSVDSQFVKLKNASFGEIAIERAKVSSLVNLSTTQGRWQGPLWLEDWDGTAETKSSYVTNAQGQLTTIANRNPLFKKIQFAPNTLIDVAFRWEGKLDLKFAFAVPKKWGKLVEKNDSKIDSAQTDSTDSTNKQDGSDMVVVGKDLSILDQAPRLEMFGDSLVLQQKELFDIILEQVDLDTGYLRLLFCWNLPSNQLQAYDTSGKLLAAIKMETLTEDFEPGIVILNQADNLTIDQVVIQSLPKEYTAEQANTQRELIAAKLETVDGNVEGFDGSNWSLRRSSDDTRTKVPAADFCLVHVPFLPESLVNATATEQPKDRDSKVVLCDGTRLTGRCLKITDNSLHLQSNIATQELIIRLDRAEQIDFPNTASQGEQSDTQILESAFARCHGWLTSDPNKPSVIQWKATGSDTAGALADADLRISQTASNSPKSNGPKLDRDRPYRDRLYLRNGDSFPANILGLQSGELQVEALNQTVTMPVDAVLRCLMDVPVPSASHTLENPPWQITTQEGNPRNGAEMLASQGNRTIRYAYHPNLLETGSFTFTVNAGANDAKNNMDGAFVFRALEIALFATKPTDSGTKLYLTAYPMPGGKRYVSLDTTGGDFGGNMDRALSLNASDKVECKVQMIDSELVASINGLEVVRKRLKLGPDSPRGVSIRLDDQFKIETVRQDGGNGFSSVKLSSENRELCLTQPRYIAQQSPRSILVGHNADLWRADIVSMNDQSLTVRSGGRHIVVDRKLVSSLVWPEKAVEVAATSDTSKNDNLAVERGAVGVVGPRAIEDQYGVYEYATIRAYGDTTHTFVNRDRYKGAFAPGFDPIDPSRYNPKTYHDTGLLGIDHIVGNVEEGKMNEWVEFYRKVLGFEQLVSFDDQDISTEYSALMSKVVQSGRGRIKFPINEPAHGRRKSQIEEYIDFYGGAGVQHIAMATNDIIRTVRALRDNDVTFLRVPRTYYDHISDRIGEIKEDIEELAELGILVDRDDEGYMLQIFTKPVQDRPTLFFEIIQREGSKSFGKGNFKALFEAIEREQDLRGTL